MAFWRLYRESDCMFLADFSNLSLIHIFTGTGGAYAQWVVSDPGNLAQSIINSAKEMVETAGTKAVSYTHLDVYKRQPLRSATCGSLSDATPI